MMRRVRTVTVAVLACLLAGCGASSAPDGYVELDFVGAVESAHGNVPLVADLTGIVQSSERPLIVRMLESDARGTVWLLADVATPEAPIVSVTVTPGDPYSPRPDRRTVAADGSVRTIEVADPPESSGMRPWIVFAVDDVGVIIESRAVGLETMIELATGLTVTTSDLGVPLGWTVVGSHDRNLFADGFTTSYGTHDEGVGISVFRGGFGHMMGFRANGATDLDLASDQPALELFDVVEPSLVVDLHPHRRVVVARSDGRIVMITGRLTDDQLAQVVRSLRPVEPGEFPIYAPQEF